MQLGLAVLRAIVGGLFFGHGTQKLAGWFKGHGLKATAEAFESMQLRPGVAHATVAGVAEAGGGVLLAAGLATPLGAAALSGTMITAIRKVHAPNGPWVAEGGYEYNLVLLAIVFAITAEGPGLLSLDALRGRTRWGTGWALGQLAAGALGSALAIELGARQDRAAKSQETPSRPAEAEPDAEGPAADARPLRSAPSPSQG
ncbi:MAG TPA: DoxX family protein [Solirubrobacteraceae bacterium]|jgi:putative oxidoreductase|nr:DoxX family protein [Solirubrobacteraceae bacterium]